MTMINIINHLRGINITTNIVVYNHGDLYLPKNKPPTTMTHHKR